MLQGLKNSIKMFFLKNKHRKNGVVFHKNTLIGYASEFEGMNVISEGSIFVGMLGYGTFIGYNSNIDAKAGRFCSIASNVNVISITHPSSVLFLPIQLFIPQKNNAGYHL